MWVRWWRLGRVGLRCLPVALMLAGAGCEYHIREVGRLPLRVEVENPGHLRVAVVGTSKRSLAATELPPFQRAGSRWEYTVRFTDSGGVGVQFQAVQATVRSLTGITATRTVPLASRVEPQGTTPIAIEAFLSTSNPEVPGNLTGGQELIFLGRDDHGQPVRVVVRVPLE